MLTDARINKLIGSLKILSEMIEKDWDWITKEDIKRIIAEIDRDPKKGAWTQHDYRLILRKFIAWLKTEHGYPDGYPNREELAKMLSIVRYPAEVSKIKVRSPDMLKPAEEIPTKDVDAIPHNPDRCKDQLRFPD